jgi:hypothetical protein
MQEIENKVQKIVLTSVPENTIQFIFNRISKFDSKYFQFNKEEFIEKKKYKIRTYNIQKKTIEKLRTTVFLFTDKYFQQLKENKHLNRLIIQKENRVKQQEQQVALKDQQLVLKDQQLALKDQQLEQKEKYIRQILDSYTYKICRIILFPLVMIKKMLKK